MKEKVIKWLKVVGIRTVKTMAETALAVIGTNTVGITNVDWIALLSACALSGVLTILFNIKSIPEISVGIKVAKTMAETAIAVIGTNVVGITEVDWLGLLSACALSGIVTILFNIKSLPDKEVS